MKTAKFIFIALTIQCFLFGQPTNAQTEQQNRPCDLKFQVKPSKEKYVPLEPIQVSYEISNPMDSPMEVWWAFPDIIFSLEVIKDNKTNTPQLSGLAARTGMSVIPPGQKIEDKEVLNFQLSNIFPDYGIYQLRFAISCRESGKNFSGRAVSNTVEIAIQPATGINAEALNYIYRTHQTPVVLGIFSRWEDKRADKTKDALVEFVEKYGESVYGDYAIFYLAYSYKSAKKYELAKKEFNKLKDKKDFGYTKEVTRALQEIEQDLLKENLKEKEN